MGRCLMEKFTRLKKTGKKDGRINTVRVALCIYFSIKNWPYIFEKVRQGQLLIL